MGFIRFESVGKVNKSRSDGDDGGAAAAAARRRLVGAGGQSAGRKFPTASTAHWPTGLAVDGAQISHRHNVILSRTLFSYYRCSAVLFSFSLLFFCFRLRPRFSFVFFFVARRTRSLLAMEFRSDIAPCVRDHSTGFHWRFLSELGQNLGRIFGHSTCSFLSPTSSFATRCDRFDWSTKSTLDIEIKTRL